VRRRQQQVELFVFRDSDQRGQPQTALGDLADVEQKLKGPGFSDRRL
jgi:hypothetical protein